jgi:hypothetical protein
MEKISDLFKRKYPKIRDLEQSVWEIGLNKNPLLRWYSRRYVKKMLFGSKKKLEKNIYGYKTVGEAYKQFNFTHYFFKYKLFVPVLNLIKIFFGKKINRDIPEEDMYVNVRIFDDMFNHSVRYWVENFLVDETHPDKEKIVESLMNGYNVEALNTMKQFMIFMLTQDTAYLEFFNILMHNMVQGMFEKYGGRKVNHVFYTSKNMYDVYYSKIFKEITLEEEWDENDKTKK